MKPITPNQQEFKQLFERYVSGEATKSEKIRLFQAIKSIEKDKLLEAEIGLLWNEIARQKQPEIPLATKDRIFATLMAEAKDEVSMKIRHPLRIIFLRKWGGVVAAILLVAGLGWFSIKKWGEIAPTNISKISHVVKSADQGHQAIELPDGSFVILHQGSSLTYSTEFDQAGDRTVYLEGRGYFDIKNKGQSHFTVIAGNTRTIVLGTAFSIEAIRGKELVVTVNRGIVKVEDDKQDYGILRAAEQLVLNESGDFLGINRTDRPHPTWISEVIYFDDATMKEAMETLEKVYGVEIHIDNEAIENCRFTAGFGQGESLEQILRVITVFNNSLYSYTGESSILIKGSGCPIK